MGNTQSNGWPYDQASAIPFRDGREGIELCLITSSGKRKWCFPKGVIDPGETPLETALKEAEEEAGLRGEIWGPPLASYRYRKWGRWLRVVVMLLRVHQVADQWDEAHLRERRWVGLEDAVAMLPSQALRRLVSQAARRLQESVGSREL